MFQRLVDVYTGIVVVFLLIVAHRQVIMRFCVRRVFYNRMFVVIYRLLQDANRAIGIGKVFVQEVIVPVFETALEEGDGLGISS